MANKKKANKKPNKQPNKQPVDKVSLSKPDENLEKANLAKADEKPAEKKSDKAAKTDSKKSADKKTDKKSDKKSEKKPSAFSKIAKFFRECKSEIKKIVWPTPKATFRNMGIVLVVLIVIGLFIYGLDTGFIALLGLIMDIGKNV